VRQAVDLALDYEWMNRQMFYGSSQRVQDLFGNTACEAQGTPTPAERALLEPWRAHIPPAAFGPMYRAPSTQAPSSLRENLRRAQALLQAAGWQVQDGVLRAVNVPGVPAGQALELEYMDSNEGGMRVVAPWMRNLEKLGIRLRFRSVDFALYQQRLQKFDFDITSLAFQGTNNPGQEFADLFGSKAAGQEAGGTFPGLQTRAVAALIAAMVGARTQEELLPACHALDRVIMHSHILVPQWFASTHRMAYNAWRLERPAVLPPYSPGEMWAVWTWWAKK